MSYQFNGTTQYLSTTSSPITTGTGDVTLACWFNSASNTASQALMVIDRIDALGRYILSANGDLAGDPVVANSGNNTTVRSAQTTTGYTVNQWAHAAGVFSGASSRTAYINGGSSGVNTDTHSFSGSPDRLRVGALFYTSINSPINGIIAEAAIWNVALTADEIASLANGFTPDQIRPQSLRFYAPLVRNLQDLRGGLAITNNNAATVATHPRIII
jgi:hypothetical protein